METIGISTPKIQKAPYNEDQYTKDIPIKCLCLYAFRVPKTSSLA